MRIQFTVLIVSTFVLLSTRDAEAQRIDVSAARQHGAADSALTVAGAAGRMTPVAASTPLLAFPAPSRADNCDCPVRIVLAAIAGGTIGALVGYQVAKIPDGGTKTIQKMGAVVGFVYGAAAAVMNTLR